MNFKMKTRFLVLAAAACCCLSCVETDKTLGFIASKAREAGITVADADRLEERLRAALYTSMPAGASHGRYADAVEITPVYGRSGSAMSPADMAMVVAQLVPAVFTDREGNRIMG